jgi:hypothetical protein
MVQLTQLWLPILLSAVAVVIGSMLCMALPIHRHEYKRMGDKQAAVMGAIRSWGLPGGMYLMPPYDPKTRDSEAAKELDTKGPWGVLMLRDGPWNMGAMMGLWFLNAVIISVFVAYVASHALPAGAAYLRVFQIVGAVGFLAYGGSALADVIWKGRPWNTMPGAVFDAVVYGCLMAGVFGWRWPAGM